ncbi:hypothetical protein, partial [Streptococcus dysgalactiae]|uniref:hypothetical protein n=1 Tax=Streptococcus dysgalactiae TaxID=1334 RepID=UPI0024B7748F
MNLYPSHYKMAFAFSIFLYLHCYQHFLRFALLEATIQAYHVPLNEQNDRLGSTSLPAVICPCNPTM